MKKYSVDKLLKKKPKKLKGIEFSDNGSGQYYVQINGVVVFADRYEIAYGKKYVVLRFFKDEDIAATVSAFGSSKYKEDEAFIIDFSGIKSETSYRVMKNMFAKKKKTNES